MKKEQMATLHTNIKSNHFVQKKTNEQKSLLGANVERPGVCSGTPHQLWGNSSESPYESVIYPLVFSK